MEDLFISAYNELEKTADRKLSNNQLQWPNEILEQLYQVYPELATLPQSINYMSKDDDKKSAVGQVVIADAVNIPFVIDSGYLKPLVVFYPAGESITGSMPLTQNALAELLFKNRFYKGLAPRKRNFGSTVVNSGISEVPVKTASLLEGLDGTVRSEDKVELLKSLNDKRILTKLAETKNEKILEKIASLETSLEKTASLEFEEDIYVIYKNAGLGYTKLSGNSQVYDPHKIELREIDVPGDIPLIKTSAKNVKALDKVASIDGTIKYKNHNYEIIKLDPGFSTKTALLVNSNNDYIDDFTKEANWEYSDKFVEHKVDSTLVVGDQILIKTASNKFCGPVSVSSAFKTKGNWNIHGSIGLKKIAFIEEPRLSNTIVKSAEVYIPKAEFIKLAKKIHPETNLEKKANQNHFVSKRDGEYYFVGPAFEKFSSMTGVKRPLSQNEAVWNLIQLGASESVIKQAQILSNGREFIVNEKLEVPITKEAFVKTGSSSSQIISDFVKSKFRGLIKEAVATGNPETLDTILGLNLINEDNITFLIQSIPTIDQTLNILSRLYLMAIAGMKTINEVAVQSILSKLSTIKETLQGIALSLQNKK